MFENLTGSLSVASLSSPLSFTGWVVLCFPAELASWPGDLCVCTGARAQEGLALTRSSAVTILRSRSSFCRTACVLVLHWAGWSMQWPYLWSRPNPDFRWREAHVRPSRVLCGQSSAAAWYGLGGVEDSRYCGSTGPSALGVCSARMTVCVSLL